MATPAGSRILATLVMVPLLTPNLVAAHSLVREPRKFAPFLRDPLGRPGFGLPMATSAAAARAVSFRFRPLVVISATISRGSESSGRTSNRGSIPSSRHARRRWKPSKISPCHRRMGWRKPHSLMLSLSEAYSSGDFGRKILTWLLIT